eukprot:6183327-Pleurochrysis_carterae.AAC.1
MCESPIDFGNGTCEAQGTRAPTRNQPRTQCASTRAATAGRQGCVGSAGEPWREPRREAVRPRRDALP